MEDNTIPSDLKNDTKKQERSNYYTATQATSKPRRCVIKSGLSLLGLFLINLLSKSGIFAQCIGKGFNESDGSCYGPGIAFAAICALRCVLAITPTAYMILILVNLKKAQKKQIRAMLPYIIISIILAVVAIVYFVGILFEVF